MTAQLLTTWLHGDATLSHRIGPISIYQHRQYVPVVLASAALVAAGALWHHPKYRPWTFPLLLASVVYALSAFSLLAIAVAGAGLAVFALRRFPEIGWRRGLAGAAVAVTAVGMQLALLRDTTDHQVAQKLTTYDRLANRVTAPCTVEELTFAWPSLIVDGETCVVRRTIDHGLPQVLTLAQREAAKGDVLVVEGELREGGVSVLLRRRDESILSEARVSAVGPFTIELPAEQGPISAEVASSLPRSKIDDWSIKRVYWRLAASPMQAGGAAMAPEWAKRLLPLNAAERIGDWILFGRPIFSSIETFLLGHDRPIDRRIRSSPHNYYIDLAYNFGVLAMLPILLLIAYTVRAVWQRRDVWRIDRLMWVATVVLFLVLIDSNFKVTLRQPYPGIFAFFLWGVLLARLRTPSITATEPTDAAHTSRSRPTER